MMMKGYAIAVALVAALILASAAQAGIVTVTQTDPQGWAAENVRYSGSVAITDTQPRSGNGSLEFSSMGGSDKADYAYYASMGSLGALDALSYDWYRDSSSGAPGHLNPAFRLIVYDSVANEYSYLIWEGVYNGYNAANLPTDAWTTEDILDGYFWQRNITQGLTVEQYNHDLSYWATQLNNATIVGLNVGIGSGWAGSFLGFVDNVTIGFTGADATTWNFETDSVPVPEPASILMLGAAAFGVFAARRRK